eukprot:s1711_g1.t1
MLKLLAFGYRPNACEYNANSYTVMRLTRPANAVNLSHSGTCRIAIFRRLPPLHCAARQQGTSAAVPALPATTNDACL